MLQYETLSHVSYAALGFILCASTSPVAAAEPSPKQQAEAASEVGERRADGSVAIACSLTSAEQRQRKQAMQAQLFASLSRVTELDDGYTLWFPRSEGQLAMIAHFIELESQCCAFLDFEIRVAAGGDSIAVDLTGPEGTKEVLQAMVDRGP